MVKPYFMDLHIHIGRDLQDQYVKITASNQLTLTNILEETSERKGIQIVGIIDAQSPGVQAEIKQLIQKERAYELEDGGIRFKEVTLILGAEIEIYDENCYGPIHVLCFIPTLTQMTDFSRWLARHMKNITLSSQRFYGSAHKLQTKVKEYGGIFIPAHVFTPFKSLYGKGVKQSLTEVFNPQQIDAIELGLSSDTSMADQIKELQDYTYVSNSDAHSLQKIGREYQEIVLKEPSFKELDLALQEQKGRYMKRNFGMNPKLGKYYLTVCRTCDKNTPLKESECIHCGSQKIIKGVAERIQEIAERSASKKNKERSKKRPPYIYQVPLEFLPTLGPKTYERLIDNFKTEMNIIHHVSVTDLREVVSDQLAEMILQNRQGKLGITAGGGGRYGRIT